MSGKTIAETLAALGVIASLVFVGLELKQSNAQARAAAYQSIGVATAAAWDSWAHDPEFAAMSLKDPADMTPLEWERFTLKANVFTRLMETILLQVEQDVLSEDALRSLGYGTFSNLFDDPRLACVWPTLRLGASEELRSLVERSRNPSEVDCSGYAIHARPGV